LPVDLTKEGKKEKKRKEMLCTQPDEWNLMNEGAQGRRFLGCFSVLSVYHPQQASCVILGRCWMSASLLPFLLFFRGVQE